MTVEQAAIRGIKSFMESRKYYQKQIDELVKNEQSLKMLLKEKGWSEAQIAEALAS